MELRDLSRCATYHLRDHFARRYRKLLLLLLVRGFFHACCHLRMLGRCCLKGLSMLRHTHAVSYLAPNVKKFSKNNLLSIVCDPVKLTIQDGKA